MEIKILKDILQRNEDRANQIRSFLNEKKSVLFNVMGSPGAGKTSFITSLINRIDKNIYVIEGDVASSIDAQKIASLGVKTIQINTGGACHLVSETIFDALNELKIDEGSIIFVENIGNLICPASFDIGENYRIVISSAAEGDDKPYKYPDMFEKADLVVLSKMDVADIIGFDKQNYLNGLNMIKDNINLVEVSFKTGYGLDNLIQTINKMVESKF